MITRELQSTILSHQKSGFINLIYGPRRVGKTTLLHQLTQDKSNVVWYNGDTIEAQTALGTNSETRLINQIEHKDIIIVDEAQRISGIGLALKIMIDKFPEKTFYVSGSSSLWLARGTKEALTGRFLSYKLYPLSLREIMGDKPLLNWQFSLESQLTWGNYPQIISLSTAREKQEYLRDLIESYLFKDVYSLVTLYEPELLHKLAVLLAHQIGSQVSYNEMATILNSSVKTIERYLNLLEESFVIIKIPSFSRNPRNELKNSKKYYFWDLGIRNALIGQFSQTEYRPDKGHLWENYCIVERLKIIEYARFYSKFYFWRNYNQAEIDWIEEGNNILQAFEFKYSKTTSTTPPSFFDKYKVKAKTINTHNFLEFIGPEQIPK